MSTNKLNLSKIEDSELRVIRATRRSAASLHRSGKRTDIVPLRALLLPLLLFCGAARAQTFCIDRFVLGGGGGTSTGGAYSVSGTIGQPDASGAMTGGNYSVTGGFWALFAMQTAGAPPLRIFLTTTNTAVLAWRASSLNWALQSNTNLTATNWTSVLDAVNVVGNDNQVIISPPAGNRYFRLFKSVF